VIQPEQADLLESPCALVVGSVDRAGLPDATRGWGLEVLDGGNRVRVLLSTSASTTIANARETRRLAITATHFATLVSVQVKGMVTAVEDARPADRIRFVLLETAIDHADGGAYRHRGGRPARGDLCS